MFIVTLERRPDQFGAESKWSPHFREIDSDSAFRTVAHHDQLSDNINTHPDSREVDQMAFSFSI
jgi:hypothetical protein